MNMCESIKFISAAVTIKDINGFFIDQKNWH